jgi:hypothetical protein
MEFEIRENGLASARRERVKSTVRDGVRVFHVYKFGYFVN